MYVNGYLSVFMRSYEILCFYTHRV